MVASQTSEVRLPFRIKALLSRYHESPAYNDEVNEIQNRWNEHKDPEKCEKITLEILYKKDVVLTITVFVSTGPIHILGHYFKEWGREEFQYLVSMANHSSKL